MEGVDERLPRTGALAGGLVLHRDPRPVDHLGVDSGLSTPEVLDSLTELSSVIRSQLSVWTKTYARGFRGSSDFSKAKPCSRLGEPGNQPQGSHWEPIAKTACLPSSPPCHKDCHVLVGVGNIDPHLEFELCLPTAGHSATGHLRHQSPYVVSVRFPWRCPVMTGG